MRPMRPSPRSRSSHARCSRHPTRLCTCSMSTRPPYHASWLRSWSRASSAPGAQIFVATVASARRPSSAAASARSAPPYIGEESNSRTPASRAAATTVRASRSSESNVLHVPSPTTGPRRRSSITGYGSCSRSSRPTFSSRAARKRGAPPGRDRLRSLAATSLTYSDVPHVPPRAPKGGTSPLRST